MKNRPRGGLGRGLGALIPTAPAAAVATDEVSPPPAPAPTQFTAPAVPEPEREPEPQRNEPTSELAPVPGARFAELPVTAIVPNPKQPRHVFDEEALEELKISIQEVGFLQPIVVRDIGDGSYELVMGERRWRAAQAVGKDTISRRSSATPATTRCCATPCSRTFTAPT
jgi:ParB family transcriptional regulator, chromosome partitioning protein